MAALCSAGTQRQMSWFRRKIKVGAVPFITDRVEKAFGDEAESIRSALRSAKVETSEEELLAYSAFNQLSAMTLAGLSQSVRYRFVEEAIYAFEERFPGRGEHIQQRLAQYSEAFGRDAALGKEALAPNLLGRALDAMIGASDESVVAARMALVFVQRACLEATVPFYKDLKVIE